MWRTELKYRLEYLAVRLLVCLLQTVSISTGAAWARGFGYLAADVLRLRGKLVTKNLAAAFPDWPPAQRQLLARRMWEHLFLMVVEIAHLPRKLHETNWREYVRLANPEVLTRALLDDRPLVLVTAHYGNFELSGFVLGIFGFPTFTVARRLDNPYLDAFVNRFRAKTGQQIIPKKGGFEQIVSVLQERGALALLSDQYAGNKGCWVDFFGRPASTHKAIALFALANDAPIICGFSRRLGRPLWYEFESTGRIDPRDQTPESTNPRLATQWYTSKIEQFIRRAPEQYWWLHDRWKEPRKRQQARRAA